MKKSVLLILPALFLLACGGTTSASTNTSSVAGNVSSSSSNISTTSNTTTSTATTSNTTTANSTSVNQKFTISFANNLYEDIIKNEGETIESLPTPTKDDYIFEGWYLNGECTEKVSLPLTVTKNITLYPNFLNYKDYFFKARENTIIDNYNYTDTLTVSSLLMGSISGPGGEKIGSVQVREGDFLSYYAKHENSGLLFGSNTTYSYVGENTLTEIAIDKENNVDKYSSETIEEIPTSVFADAIFLYSEEEIKEVAKGNANTYEITSSINASTIISKAISFLGSGTLDNIVSGLPEADAAYDMIVTYKDNCIDTFTYEFEIEISGQIIDFNYEMQFSNIGDDTPITLPSLPDISISDEDKTEDLTTINNSLNDYKELANSAYDYDLNIDLKYENATASVDVTGETKRQVSSDVYFSNLVDVATNLEDALNIEDYKITRANLKNGDVYNCVNKLFGDEYNPSTENANDDYYMLLSNTLTASDTYYISFNDGPTNDIYSISLTNSGAKKLLNFFDDQIVLSLTNDHELFPGIDSFSLTTCEFTFTTNAFGLKEIALNIEGTLTNILTPSFQGECNLTLDYQLTVDQEYKSYTVPETTDDIDLY